MHSIYTIHMGMSPRAISSAQSARFSRPRAQVPSAVPSVHIIPWKRLLESFLVLFALEIQSNSIQLYSPGQQHVHWEGQSMSD